VTWQAAMRWALMRARDTGVPRQVYGYFRWMNDGTGLRKVWAYAVREKESK
jgi:hypothetical protein